MKQINLRDYYPWYIHDELVEVPDEVAAELLAEKRYQRSHERRMRRNGMQYLLDAEDRIVGSMSFTAMSTYEVLEYKWMFCRLCCALNSLPEIQGRRVAARYLLGMSRKEIAAAEGASDVAVYKSIEKGLKTMKKYLRDFE